MIPNVELPVCAVSPGLPKFGWLNRSNTSARNSVFKRSVIFVTLASETSAFLKSGPTIELRAKFPKWNTFFPFTVATGKVKTAPEGQLALPTGERGSQTLFANHCTPLLTIRFTKIGL